MEKNCKTTCISKAIGLFCAVVMLVCALYVPLALSVGAITSVDITDDTPVVFDFEDVVTDDVLGADGNSLNYNEATGDAGIGYYGWGPVVRDVTDAQGNTNSVLCVDKTTNNSYPTAGGYRLHTKKADGTYGVYKLEPSTRYVVSFKIRVKASPKIVEGSNTANKARVYIGYNSQYNPKEDGQGSNYINRIGKKIPVMESLIDSNTFSLYDTNGKTTGYNCSEEWHTVRYSITTPTSFTADPALAFWADKYHGVQCEIDDVSVIKLGANSGIVTFVDQYSGTEEIVCGEIGAAVTLPDISGRSQQADHIFEGWYTDEERTQKAENITFGAQDQILYSRWKAPVVVTFKNTLDGTESKVSGAAGDAIPFPNDPVDPSGQTWFMGWYTDEACTNKFTSDKFGYANATLYSFFKGKIPGLVQDFENYTRDAWIPKEVDKICDNGTPDKTSDDYTFPAVYKSNYLDFYTTMSKQSNIVYSGKYAVKFHWNSDPAMNKDVSNPKGQNVRNPESYTQSRYNVEDNYFNVGTGLENNTTYVVSFMYYAEKADYPVNFYAISSDDGNTWANRVIYGGPKNVELITDGKWHELSYEITTGFSGTGTQLYVGILLNNNEDTIVYFDDIKFEAFAQPYESAIKIHTNISDEVFSIKGNRGDEIEFPALSHPDGAPFLGWYTNSTFTNPFVDTVYPKGNVEIYAKWGPTAMTFKSYPFAGHPYFDPYLSVKTEKGLGNGDDHAMHWKLVRNAENSGAGSKGFAIYKGIKDGATYKIKYDYKVNSANNREGTLAVVSAPYENIYVSTVKTKYQATQVKIPAGSSNGWHSVEAYVTAKVLRTSDGYTVSDSFFLQFDIPNGTGIEGTHMDVLIDNVYVEEIEAPYVSFDAQNNTSCVVAQGKAGDKIQFPAKPAKIGNDFKGWYLEPECITPFELTTFEANTAMTVYAKWGKSTSATYSFEGYTLTAGLAFKDGELSSSVAKTGKNSLKYGNRTPDIVSSRSYFAIEDSGEYFKLEYKRQYVITMNYYIKSCAPSTLNISFVASTPGNIYAGLGGSGVISGTQSINYSMAKAQKGKWTSMTFAIDTSDVKDTSSGQPNDGLFVQIRGGENWEIYFDEVTITEVPKGKSLVVLDTEGAKAANTYFIGSVGASYANKIPEKLSRDGMVFKGYYSKSASGSFDELKRENMKFAEKATVVYARFLEREIIENFDEGFYGKAYDEGQGYTIHDFDYEVYDSEKLGNSKENVTSGRYSLHRKGNTMYNENSVILTLGNQISEGERYTVTFKVKMGKHLHTDGAIKIASGRSFKYAWTTTGDYHPVVAIADLADGQWHEVSYTFNSVEAFSVLQTPGYVELFIDDVKYTLVDENTPLSTPVAFTEYVPAERDADGNLLLRDRTAVDISSIIDASLNGSSVPWLWIIIGAVVLLVLAGGVTAIVIIKKKKAKA